MTNYSLEGLWEKLSISNWVGSITPLFSPQRKSDYIFFNLSFMIMNKVHNASAFDKYKINGLYHHFDNIKIFNLISIILGIFTIPLLVDISILKIIILSMSILWLQSQPQLLMWLLFIPLYNVTFASGNGAEPVGRYSWFFMSNLLFCSATRRQEINSEYFLKPFSRYCVWRTTLLAWKVEYVFF